MIHSVKKGYVPLQGGDSIDIILLPKMLPKHLLKYRFQIWPQKPIFMQLLKGFGEIFGERFREHFREHFRQDFLSIELPPSWHGCDFVEPANDDEPGFIEHTCNTLDDLEEMNCKRFSSETSTYTYWVVVKVTQ